MRTRSGQGSPSLTFSPVTLWLEADLEALLFDQETTDPAFLSWVVGRLLAIRGR